MRHWTPTIAMDRLANDVRFACRLLARSPGFTAVAVGTLALGIGATTAIFTVVNAVLLQPLPFPNADQLVMVWERPPDRPGRNVVQTQNFLDWHARSRSFDGLAALLPLPMTLSGDAEEAEQVMGLSVTGDFFPLLGVTPLLGRGLRPGDDAPGAPASVVLTHRLWQRRFGGDPSIVGRRITVDGMPRDIVGVMPAGFAFPGTPAELFAAARLDPATAVFDGRNLQTVARLRAGITREAAQAEMTGIAAQTAQERPKQNARWGATVIPLHEQAVGDVRLALAVLFGAVLCVLLIACVNLANLLSMRSSARAHEIDVRLALGASAWRVTRQLLVESLVLAGIGGGLGLALAWAGVPLLLALFTGSATGSGSLGAVTSTMTSASQGAIALPRADEIRVDVWVLAFAFGVSMIAGLLFGMTPALTPRRTLSGALHGSGRAVTPAGTRLRAILVVAEVTLAVVLVIGAGLMVRSLVRLSRVDPGFRPDRVVTLRTFLSFRTYGRDVPRRAAFVDAILERVRALPHVTSAASIHFLPLRGESGTGYYRVDRPAPPPGEIRGGGFSVVSPQYFRTMGIPLIAGRDFDTRDRIDAPRVVLINQTMARRVFPGEDPIGKRLRVAVSSTLRKTEPEWEIIGIVGDVRHNGLQHQPGPYVFVSQNQEPNLRVSLVLRTSGDPIALVRAVRAEIAALDPEQGISDVEAMDHVVAGAVARPRSQTALLGAFGALALAMACVGLYGVLSYSVAQRTREMGVRLALGAAPGAILRLVVGEGLRLTAAGIVIGLAAAFVLTRFLATLLYDVQPHDPAVFAAVAVALPIVGGLACWLPARRATRVDPAAILRSE